MGAVVVMPFAVDRAKMRREILRGLPLWRLRRLWDEYDGSNSPCGFEGEDIHSELNRRSDGEYCAV